MTNLSETAQLNQALLGARQLHLYLKTPQGHQLIGEDDGPTLAILTFVINRLEDRRKVLREAIPEMRQLTFTQGAPPLDTPVHPEDAC